MANDSYIWIEKGKVERRFANGKRERLDRPLRQTKYGPKGGWWQKSMANGVVPLPGAIKQAKEMDAAVGAPRIEYDQRTGEACFSSRAEKNRWLRAHKRVDADAGYRDPAPGDFRDQVPGEFDDG